MKNKQAIILCVVMVCASMCFAMYAHASGDTPIIDIPTVSTEPTSTEQKDEYNISGRVVVAMDKQGTTYPSGGENEGGIGGITLSLEQGDKLAASMTTDADGAFSFPDIQIGEYTLVITGPTALTRTAQVVVSDHDITSQIIPIVVCDYDGDSGIGGSDTAYYTGMLFSGNAGGKDPSYYDLDCDNGIGGSDTGIYTGILFASKAVYDELIIQ